MQCPASLSLDAVCTSNKTFDTRMAAIPHTASSSTDALFRVGKRAWNISVFRMTRASFVQQHRANNTSRSRLPPCRKHVGNNASTHLFGCVLGNFHYPSRIHKAYNQMYSMSAVVFTALRDPAQFVLSQYTMKQSWDKQ
jgi:hypothetical protein